MRIVHLTTLHSPLDVRIFEKECRSLAADGHDVHLVAPSAPTGERERVTFHPIGREPAEPGVGNLLRRLRAAWRAASALGAEVYHLHDPELIPVGVLLRLRGRRFVYDAHEDTPREVAAMNRRRPVVALLLSLFWQVLGRIAGRAATAVVAATPAIAARFPAGKTVVVRNFPTASERERFVGGPHAERPPSVVYLGGVTEIRGAHEMAAAIERVSTPSARLVLAGRVQEPELEGDLRSERIDVRSWLPRDEVAGVLRSARVGLLVLHPVDAHRESLPIKLFEYLAAGIPVVASDFPGWRELIDGAGVFVDPHDVDAIAAAVDELLRDPVKAESMGARGRELVASRYSWEHEADKLLSVYERLA